MQYPSKEDCDVSATIVLKTLKRSNHVYQALSLPVIANINPRSLYNKLEEFHTFVEEEELDLVFVSESWERANLTLNNVINLEDFIVVSNVHQRRSSQPGGRQAIIVNSSKYHVENMTNTTINVKWGVEAVWCLLTPKNVTNTSKIQKIACAAIYSKPNSKSKSDLLDNIAEAFNIY